MRYTARPPAAPLAPFVDSLWALRDAEALHGRERIVPSGTLELVINLDEDELRIDDGGDCRRFSGVARGAAPPHAAGQDPPRRGPFHSVQSRGAGLGHAATCAPTVTLALERS